MEAITFDQYTQDMAWIDSNYVLLKESYSDRYIAVVDGGVVDHDCSIDELVARLVLAHGDRVPEMAVKFIYQETPNMVFVHSE